MRIVIHNQHHHNQHHMVFCMLTFSTVTAQTVWLYWPSNVRADHTFTTSLEGIITCHYYYYNILEQMYFVASSSVAVYFKQFKHLHFTTSNGIDAPTCYVHSNSNSTIDPTCRTRLNMHTCLTRLINVHRHTAVVKPVLSGAWAVRTPSHHQARFQRNCTGIYVVKCEIEWLTFLGATALKACDISGNWTCPRVLLSMREKQTPSWRRACVMFRYVFCLSFITYNSCSNV